ncbi:MAG TPA: sigma-54-dependent Fis family transcriptional regulator, partial [Verrucomicrobiales bacterium]|nr:sigma-54-dependent Fis family transcriptional regulator [Verrucomicrobiales bacterium]
ESELFGHVKGSFTGALKDTWGKVAMAEGGTLFLDEIGELPSEIQPKLLRLLQEQEYERLGEHKTRRANVRVIAATNRDLAAAVKEGRFREDLFYRLNVITLELPPLRRRTRDLQRLADNYLKFFNRQCGRNKRGFSEEARQALARSEWKGNLRELRNAVERAVVLGAGEWIGPEDLPAAITGSGAAADHGELEPGMNVSLKALEREHIRRIIDRTDTLEEAAAVLEIDPATLYRKRKRLFGREGNGR